MRASLFCICVFVAGAASAQNMALTTFVERGTKLEKKGAMALFHRGEIRALQTEMQGASTKLREERLAAERAGRKPAYCPPANGQQGLRMDPREMLSELRAIPAPKARTMTTADGFRLLLARRFPCPAA
jgi:hypothetical protein